MIYNALVIKIDENVEEAITLQINDVILTCFASFCPYAISEGMIYPIQLDLMIFDDYDVKRLEINAAPAFHKIGKDFSYKIDGKLNGLLLEVCGLVFQDEIFLGEFAYLDGEMVAVKADRIDVHFLPQWQYYRNRAAASSP